MPWNAEYSLANFFFHLHVSPKIVYEASAHCFEYLFIFFFLSFTTALFGIHADPNLPLSFSKNSFYIFCKHNIAFP